MSAERLTHWQGEPVATWRALWEVPAFEAYERIGSTSDRAKDLAAEPGYVFAVVIAHEQSKGRGRRGASWHSASGSGLWMSVVLPGSTAPARTPPALHVPLLVGLAAAEAIQDLSPEVRVGIEWPNDLVVQGRKLGGILCEGMPDAVVAGIGINLKTPEDGYPAPIAERATSLEAEGVPAPSAGRLAGLLVKALKRHVAEPTEGLSPEALRELSARDALAARAVRTEQHGSGTARGIQPDGALMLERPDGSRVRVLAGSVRPE
ncbi:MAG: biotin--[acetyl-CoA-carboxylase] ligase [Gemmatimonadota bacterium]